MSETNCEIVFRGKILSGFERDQVCRNLSQLLGLAPSAVESLLDAPKTVLRSGMDRQAAAQFRDSLLAAGIMVAVVTQSGVPTAAVAAPGAITSEAANGTQPGTGTTNRLELSLSELGTAIAERRAFEAPTVNLKGLRISRSNAPLETRAAVAPRDISVPDLPLADIEPEKEKVYTKLEIELMRDSRRP